MIMAGLSSCGTCASGTQQAFLGLAVAGLGVTDIRLLQAYVHLQDVDISYNHLTGEQHATTHLQEHVIAPSPLCCETWAKLLDPNTAIRCSTCDMAYHVTGCEK